MRRRAVITSIGEMLDFLHLFLAPLSDQPGLPESSVPDDLPAPLRQLYIHFGALIHRCPNGPFSTQDRISPVHKLVRDQGELEFAWENQGNWRARCELGIADPDVYVDHPPWTEHDRDPGHKWWCRGPLSRFVVTLALQEAVMGCPYLWAVRAETTPEASTVPFEPLWMNGQFAYGEGTHSFLFAPEGDILAFDCRDQGVLWGS